MNSKEITKLQLIDIIKSWGEQKITIEKLQIWMLDNFEPDEMEIGKGEDECTIEAMHIVMNEYELAQEEKCLQAQYRLAITYINCSEENYNQCKSDFLRHAFCD